MVEEPVQMVGGAPMGQVGVEHIHLPWGVVGVVLRLQGVGEELHHLLQSQRGHVWLVAGQAASCPALAAA